MQKRRRAIKILSTTMLASTLLSQEASAQQTVVVTGYLGNYSTGYSGGLDGYMGQFFGGSTVFGSGFSVPEAEAFVQFFGFLLSGKSNPHFTFSVCSATPGITPDTKATKSSDEPELRLIAARQMLTAAIPNFANTKKNGLLVRVIFADGGSEVYRHTTLYNWQPVDGTHYAPNGINPTC